MTTPLSKWNMNSREFLFADPEGDSPVVLQMKVCFAVPSEETDSPGVKRSAPSSSFLQTKFCKSIHSSEINHSNAGTDTNSTEIEYRNSN